MGVIKLNGKEYSGGGGSGSLDAVETTSNAYALLPQADKDDPTKIYFLNDTQPSVVDTPIDQNTFVLKVENQYHMSVAVTDGKLVSVYNYGSSIGACAFEPNAISATASKIKFKFTTIGSYDTAQSHAITIGVKANYQSSNWIFSTDTDWLVKKVYNTRNTSVDDYIDISEITTPCYLMICFHGWTVTFDEFLVEDVNAPTGDTEIRYKDIPYGDGSSVIELTQAEYDALPESKLTDGILYCITDGDGDVINFVNGVYIDASNVVYDAFTFDSTEHTWTATADCILTDNMYPPDSSTAYYIRIDGKQVFAGYSAVDDPFVYVKKGQVVTYRGKSGSIMKAYGVQTGSVSNAQHNYSTSEQVVGTWIDGKPLYEITIEFSSEITVNNNAWTNTTISTTDKKAIVNVIGINSTGTCWNMLSANCDNGSYVQVYHTRGTSITLKTLTIQYTKTTD